MNRKVEKICSIIVFVIILLTIATNVLAAVSDFTGSTEGDGFTDGKTKIINIVSAILSVVRTVGVGVSVLILMVLGCKYMIASAGERAEIKKYAITYVIGAIVLFASSAIIGIIKDFVDKSMTTAS